MPHIMHLAMHLRVTSMLAACGLPGRPVCLRMRNLPALRRSLKPRPAAVQASFAEEVLTLP